MISATSISVVRPYLLDISFSDGTTRRVDVAPLLWGELFEPLRESEYFAQARFDPDIRTVSWPNGADIAPENLYEHGIVVREFQPIVR